MRQLSNKLKQNQPTKNTGQKCPQLSSLNSYGNESPTCCAQSHRVTAPRARFRSPGSDPRPESGPESSGGQMPPPLHPPAHHPCPPPQPPPSGLCGRLSGDPLRCNRTRSAEEAPSQSPIPCRGRASGPPHLQLRAHVPATAGPESRASVVPAAARPSVSAPPESAPCSSQDGKGPLARAEKEPGVRGGGALAGSGTRCASPAWTPGGRRVER